MSITESKLAAQLGPPVAFVKPVVLEVGPRFSRKATVTVTEHEQGWLITGVPTGQTYRYQERHGHFTGVVLRCLLGDQCKSVRGNHCLGHKAKVLALAQKVLLTYR